MRCDVEPGTGNNGECPRCGKSAEFTTYGICALCTASEGFDPPCEACKAEGEGRTAITPHVETCATGALSALLQAVQDGLYWQDQNGLWRHNTGTVEAWQEKALERWAQCRPGRTAHLTLEGWGKLHPEEAQ